MRYWLGQLNTLVYEERYREQWIKNAFALFGAVVCAALLWFFRGWFFVYEGFGIIKIAALTLVFVGLLAMIWLTSSDPDEFAGKNFDDDSPAGYLAIGLVAAVFLRIFFSASTDALVCCASAGVSGVCFLVRMLEGYTHLQQIHSRSPKLRTKSQNICEMFEEAAQRTYRMVRFRELWYESEYNKDYKQHKVLEEIHRSLMTLVDEYEQWCCEYLRDSDDMEF